MVLADYDLGKAQAAAARLGDARFVAEKVDAGNPAGVAALAKKHGVDIICNLCAPEFNPQLLQAALHGRDALSRHGDDASPSRIPPASANAA